MDGMDPIDFSNANVCRIVWCDIDEYNQYVIQDEDSSIPCLFRFGLSNNANNYVDNIGTDAHCYVDLANDFIIRNKHRLEGLYLSFTRYRGETLWYQISKVIIGRTLLTTNEDNCIHLFLKKAIPPFTEESS